MASEYAHGVPVNRGTIISNVTLLQNESVFSSAVNNDVFLDLFADFLVSMTVSGDAKADFFIVYAPDGSNFENIDFALKRIDSLVKLGVTITNGTYLISNVPLEPYKFKLYVVNFGSQISGFSVTAYTRRMQFV